MNKYVEPIHTSSPIQSVPAALSTNFVDRSPLIGLIIALKTMLTLVSCSYASIGVLMVEKYVRDNSDRYNTIDSYECLNFYFKVEKVDFLTIWRCNSILCYNQDLF